MRKLTQRLAEAMANAAYAFQRLTAQLYDAPWLYTGDRIGKPC